MDLSLEQALEHLPLAQVLELAAWRLEEDERPSARQVSPSAPTVVPDSLEEAA